MKRGRCPWRIENDHLPQEADRSRSAARQDQRAAAREKSIRHGHPSTLHLWWARRPLAALPRRSVRVPVDDPDSDPDFKFDENVAAAKRAKLFDLIEELVQWDNSNNPRVINAARAEIARCVASRKLELKELKPTDVIAGAPSSTSKECGRRRRQSTPSSWSTHRPYSIPFAAVVRFLSKPSVLGLRAYASDLNPVPVLITKALIEIRPSSPVGLR